jgi:endonuclease YncB( thermonuclease family)
VEQARPVPPYRGQGDGRTFRLPYLSKDLDAGLAQITMGLAWWYEKYAMDQSAEDAGRYEFAEHEARAKRAGLWADASPIPPWDWRKAQRR